MATYFALDTNQETFTPGSTEVTEIGASNSVVDAVFATAHQVQVVIDSVGAPTITTTWAISRWGSVPNDTRPIVVKCRIRLISGGTSPDRSGDVALSVYTGAAPPQQAALYRRFWNTATGNVDTGIIDLILDSYLVGSTVTPLRANQFATQTGITVQLTLKTNSVATGTGDTVNTADLTVYEFFLEDGAPPGDILGYIPVVD